MQAVPTALRGAFQSCGQNCAGAERFLVQDAVFEPFLAAATAVARRLRQGPASAGCDGGTVDLGAMCMPGLAEKVAVLVDEAVADGAKVRGRCLLIDVLLASDIDINLCGTARGTMTFTGSHPSR
jgi:acyl-CoA reductase-like NAD-dependent aldehyde dehydrogenase